MPDVDPARVAQWVSDLAAVAEVLADQVSSDEEAARVARLDALRTALDERQLAPPLQPDAQPLPLLSCGVTEPHEEHLHPVGKHDTEVWCCGVTPPRPGTVTVNVDDLQKALWPYTDRELRAAQARLAAALAEVDRDR